MAGVGSIMCSYSTSSFYPPSTFDLADMLPVDLVNGTYACENDNLMNNIIKREFGFQGCVHTSLSFKSYLPTLHSHHDRFFCVSISN
jgi:hypothetical protein